MEQNQRYFTTGFSTTADIFYFLKNFLNKKLNP